MALIQYKDVVFQMTSFKLTDEISINLATLRLLVRTAARTIFYISYKPKIITDRHAYHIILNIIEKYPHRMKWISLPMNIRC